MFLHYDFIEESLPVTPLHPGGYDGQCIGIIQAIRFTFEGEQHPDKTPFLIHVQLNTEISENWTRGTNLIRLLVETFIRKAKVRLNTSTCRTGDLGFGSFSVLDRGNSTLI